METPKIVLLGGSNSGKTHFAGQLYGRLQRNPGELSLRKEAGTPSNLSALDEVLNYLEDGKTASHTATDTWTNVKLPVIDKQERKFDISWPDYGGEQLNNIFNSRSVAGHWQENLADANYWILLIRLSSETTYPLSLTKLSDKTNNAAHDEDRAFKWDSNAYWVEKLQILLHVAQKGTVQKAKFPRLAVLLSCYDELEETGETPREILLKRLPLLSSFIESNWSEDSFAVWGLSSLGASLSSECVTEAFLDEGPDTHGWVVPPDSTAKNSDLTLPIQWVLNEGSK